MPEKTKKEHYVPRVYLRRFCKNPEKLNVYDKANNEIRLNQHIMDIASERYFYDIDFNAFADRIDANDEIWQAAKGLDVQYIEHMFGSGIEVAYEERIGTVIDRLMNKTDWEILNCYAITEEEKEFMSLWIAHQVIRTKAFRENLSKLHQATAKVITEIVNRENEGDSKLTVLANTDKDTKRLLHGSILIDTDMVVNLAEVFLSHSWLLTVNKTSVPFATSDNPIVKIPHETSPNGVHATGFGSRKVEVFFPLSSSVGLMMFEENLALQKYNRRSTICDDESIVSQYNTYLLSSAYRIFATSEEKLDLYQEYAQEHPEICESNVSLIFGGKMYTFE